MKVEDAWTSIMGDTLDNLLPAGRYYMTINVTGSHIGEDGTETDAQLPVIKYCFKANVQ
jgi:hypothetical protein